MSAGAITGRTVALAAVLLVLGLGAVRAGDVAVASAAAVRAPLEAAAALSQSAIGERLATSFGTAGAIRDRVAGESVVDLVVLPPARLDELVAGGSVEAEGRTQLGTVRLGVAVRAGAPRPAIATEAEVRAALLASPSIGLADPASGATTGIFFAKLLDDMGLAATLRPRIKSFPDGTAAVEAVARGEVALAMGQISEIRPVEGADLVGPLPDGLQLRTTYAAGVATHAARPEAARATIAFLRSGRLAAAFLSAGFDPPDGAPPGR